MKKIALSLILASAAIFAAEANATDANATKADANASAAATVNTAACAGCHGQNFEKKALGVSKIVKDMSKADIEKALKGYKDGTYGGTMKATMQGQVKNLSEADIKAIAEKVGK